MMMKIAPPRRLPGDGISCDPNLLITAEEVVGCAFRGAMPELGQDHFSVRSCTFTGCVFPSCHLRGAQFADVVFRNCDLSNADLRGASFLRVELIDCKAVGTNFAEATFQHLRFERCKAEMAIFAASKMRFVHFDGCGLRSGAFDECRFESAQFSHCDLTLADLSGTRLRSLSFADSDIRGMRVHEVESHELKGLKISRLQACDLAHLLGVEIVDE